LLFVVGYDGYDDYVVMLVMMMMFELLTLVVYCWYCDAAGDLVDVVLVGDVGLNCYNVFINPGSYLGGVADVWCCVLMCVDDVDVDVDCGDVGCTGYVGYVCLFILAIPQFL
jgi:hypothetical protein